MCSKYLYQYAVATLCKETRGKVSQLITVHVKQNHHRRLVLVSKKRVINTAHVLK